jgi:MFS family permease
MARKSVLSPGEALYVLAFLGAHIAFMPFLVLLLPRRVAAMGGDNHLLSVLVLLGAVVASLANIAAGHASDSAMLRHGNRRRTVVAGLASLVASYGLLALAHDGWTLGVGVVGFQVAVNVLFAPVGSLIADYIPDARKGRVAGFLNCGLPLATGAIGLVAWVAPRDGAAGFGVTALMVLACVLPMVLVWPFGGASASLAPVVSPQQARLPLRNITLAWGARFLLQLGATLLTSYLYPYVAALLQGPLQNSGLHPDAAVGTLSAWAGLAACGGAIVGGYVSDVLDDRRRLLVGTPLLAALALAVLAHAPSWPVLAAAYAAFHCALAGFFAVEAAFVAAMMAQWHQRGRLLGIMNLANTLPAIFNAGMVLGFGRQMAFVHAMPGVLMAAALAALLAAVLCAALGRLDTAPVAASQ